MILFLGNIREIKIIDIHLGILYTAYYKALHFFTDEYLTFH